MLFSSVQDGGVGGVGGGPGVSVLVGPVFVPVNVSGEELPRNGGAFDGGFVEGFSGVNRGEFGGREDGGGGVFAGGGGFRDAIVALVEDNAVFGEPLRCCGVLGGAGAGSGGGATARGSATRGAV